MKRLLILTVFMALPIWSRAAERPHDFHFTRLAARWDEAAPLGNGMLGALIWQSYQVYDVPTIFATLIVVAVLGWGTNELMGEVERQVIPWRAAGRPVRAAALVAPEPRLRHFIRVWWMATRPFSFTASVTPVALGAALAAWDGKFNLLIFGLVLVGSVAIHAGTNLINDYYDWLDYRNGRCSAGD